MGLRQEKLFVESEDEQEQQDNLELLQASDHVAGTTWTKPRRPPEAKRLSREDVHDARHARPTRMATVELTAERVARHTLRLKAAIWVFSHGRPGKKSKTKKGRPKAPQCI